MAEFLQPEDVIDRKFSKNPYTRAIQVANILGLMGVDVDTIQRTFPLGVTDLVRVALEMEQNQPTILVAE